MRDLNLKRPGDSEAALGEPPIGIVRVEGGSLADARGKRLWIGASLFCAVWLEVHDVEFYETELKTLRDAGFDTFRILYRIAGQSFADRMEFSIEGLAGAVDRAYSYGLRPIITIFGDTWEPDIDTPEKRMVLVNDLHEAVGRGREEKILCWEICNERIKEPKLSVQECRELTEYLQSLTPIMVVPSMPGNPDDMVDLYDNLNAPLGNYHMERTTDGDGGWWEHCWKPFEVPWGGSGPGWPSGYGSFEPIGTYTELDPLRRSMDFGCTHILHMGLYILHTDSGKRSGGSYDRGKFPAHIGEEVGWQDTVATIQKLRELIPSDIASWGQEWNGHWKDNPFDFLGGIPQGPGDNFDGKSYRAYTTSNGTDVVAINLRVKEEITIPLRRAMKFAVYRVTPPNVTMVAEYDLGAGQSFKFAPQSAQGWNWDGDILLIKGRFT